MNRMLQLIWFVILVSFGSKGQGVELATQKGHSSGIAHIDFSTSGEYLISLGTNNEGIIWDLKLKKILTRFKISDAVAISGLKFIHNDQFIKVQSKERTYLFDLNNNELTSRAFDGDTLFRKNNRYSDPDGIHEAFIKKGAIRKEEKGKWLPKYWISVSYTNASFLAFDVSIENNLIVGVAENNAIYCNEYNTGKKVKILQGHNSSATDICFSSDGKFFATGGKDRSIIVWDTETLSKKFRLFSNIFRKNTATYSHDGSQVHIGDELGNLYSINFNAVFPTPTVKSEPHSINKITKSNYKGKPSFFICNSDNALEIKQDLENTEALKTIKFREHELTRPKGFLLQNIFNLYQEPIGEVKESDISKSGSKVLFTGVTDLPNITLAEVDGDKTKHLYAYKDQRNWLDAQFLKEDEFVSLLENSGTLYF